MKYREFADKLRLLSQLEKYELGDILTVQFHITMPKSWSDKKKELMDGKPHQQKPDIDNLVKAVMDSLSSNDAHVYHITASKYWAKQGSVNIEE
jgi:Holliday junction resolvase RusA-like endonuclease